MVTNDNEDPVSIFPTMKTLKSENNEAHAEEKAGEEKSSEAVSDQSGFFTPNEKIDFTGVKIEPLFADQVDFDTFSKSDFRAVKVKECSAVPKSKKLLKFVLDDGTGAGRKDPDCHHESPAESDDGDRLLRHAPVRGEREKRRGRAASSDGGQPHPGRREAVLIRGKSQAENLQIFTTNPSRFFAVTPDLQHLYNKKSNDGTS